MNNKIDELISHVEYLNQSGKLDNYKVLLELIKVGDFKKKDSCKEEVKIKETFLASLLWNLCE